VAVVETVRGPVDLGNLGQTLMHEHVFVLSTEHVQNYGSDWWDEEAMVARAIDKLNAVYAKGIHTIVDPTVWGLGRYIPRIQRIAAQTPINIVVATGLYAFEELPHQYEHRGPGLAIDIPEPMVTDFSRDITDGIADTGVKAAFLKCALETPEATPGVERITRAIARTHVETGAPITVHTSGPHQTGRIALRIFREEGVDLAKVVIGHAGDSNDLDYLAELADAGCCSAWTGSGWTCSTRRPNGSRQSPPWPAAGTPRAWCWRTTPTASSTISAPRTTRCAPPSCRTGITSTSPTTCCPPCWRRASPRRRSTR